MVTKCIVWEGEGMYASRASGDVRYYFSVHSHRDACDNGLSSTSVVTVHDLRYFDTVLIVSGDAWPPYLSGQDIVGRQGVGA